MQLKYRQHCTSKDFYEPKINLKIPLYFDFPKYCKANRCQTPFHLACISCVCCVVYALCELHSVHTVRPLPSVKDDDTVSVVAVKTLSHH